MTEYGEQLHMIDENDGRSCIWYSNVRTVRIGVSTSP